MRPDWLQSIPSSWGSAPFGSIFTQSKKKNYRLQRDFVLSVIKDRGVIPYTEKGNVGNKVSDDLSGYKLVDRGDFVLNSMNLYMGSVGVSEYEGVTSTAYIVCKPSGDVFAGYYNYLIQFKGFQEYVGLLGKGIMEIREAVRWTALKSVFVPLPDLPTQRAIADFLDRETARIDLLIQKKQRLVALLGEKRSATITAAVTGKIEVEGVRIRDCRLAEGGGGIMARLKHLTRLQYGSALAADSREEGEWNVYGSNGVVGTHSSRNTLEPAIMVGRKGSAGKVAWAEKGGFCIDTAYFVDDRHCFGDLRFSYYVLVHLKLDHHSKDSAVPGLDRNDAQNLEIDIPDLPTQRAIADFLDHETTRLQQIQETTQQSIDRLKEYRSALITAAVTGQIDVVKWGKSGVNERQLNSLQAEMEH